MQVTICGNYGAKNIGDELILEGLIKLLREIDDEIKINVLSDNPTETENAYNVRSSKKFPAGFRSLISFIKTKNKKNIKHLKQSDFFILGGGGLFGGPDKKANFIWFMQCIVAIFYKKPIIIIGQSIGKNLGFFGKQIVKFISKKAKYISLRDHSSTDVLKKINPNLKNIYLYPDLALNLDLEESEGKQQREIAFALRNINTIDENFIKGIQDFIKWILQNTDYKVKLLSFQGGKKDNDEKLNMRVIKDINGDVEIKKNTSKEELIKEYYSSDIVVTMRLHSMILAIKTKTPFIAISYAEKVNAFYKYSGLNGFIIKQKNISLEILKSYFHNLLENSTEYKNEMEAFSTKSKNELKKQKYILKDLFNKMLS